MAPPFAADWLLGVDGVSCRKGGFPAPRRRSVGGRGGGTHSEEVRYALFPVNWAYVARTLGGNP